VTDPDTGQAIRTEDILPEIAVDRQSGALYAVWQDARFSSPPRGHANAGIALSKSTDGGLHWSAPVQVNQRTDVQAFTPSVEVASNGTVAVTYYDFRNNTSDPDTLPTDYWIVRSHDGGATFGNEEHVAGPFDMETAPFARGFFVGDYEGLTTIGNTFVPVFVQANSGNTTNRTDVFETTASP
jgi:Neuraminidase (sialidase)